MSHLDLGLGLDRRRIGTVGLDEAIVEQPSARDLGLGRNAKHPPQPIQPAQAIQAPQAGIEPGVMEKIAHVLSATGAGLQGRPIPQAPWEIKAMAQAQAQASREQAALDVVLNGIKTLEDVPDGKKTSFMKAIVARAGRLSPVVGADFASLAEDPATASDMFSEQMLARFGDDVTAIRRYQIKNPVAFEELVFNDKLPDLSDKVLSFLQTTGLPMDFDFNKDGQPSVAEAVSYIARSHPEVFSRSELRMMQSPKNADAMSSLFGLPTQDVVSARQKASRTLVNMDIPNKDGTFKTIAVTMDTQGGFRDVRGDQVTLPIGTRKTISGRTEQDIMTTEGFKRLSKTQLARTEEDLVGLDNNLIALEKIQKNYEAEYLTVFGRAGAKAGRALDYLGDLGASIDSMQGALTGWDATQFAAKQSDYIGAVDRFFNIYRVSVTGAQAAWIELQELKKNLINGNMPPEAFALRLRGLLAEVKDNIARNRKLLRDGVDIAPMVQEERAQGDEVLRLYQRKLELEAQLGL